MKYRVKLYISFIGLIVVISLIGVGLIYFETRSFLFNELKSKVLSISATTSALIDGDLVEKISQNPDVESKAYQKVRKKLFKIKNVNRREDIYVDYLYTIYPNPNNQNEILLGVDTSDREFIFPGSIYHQRKRETAREYIETYHVPQTFVEDQWGKFLIAYSPVLNRNGRIVGSLVVNTEATIILEKLHALMLLGIISLIIGVVLSVIMAYFLSNQMTEALVSLQEDVQIIGTGDLDHKCVIKTNDEFNHLANEINQMSSGLKEKEKIKTNFAKYVSKQILEKILDSKEEVRLEGERKEVTILFSDIIGFSKISEKYPPKEVVSLLNEYFREMLDIIIEHDGTIDKFIGEGIMVEFGAPIEDDQQGFKAVQAAVQMHRRLQALEKRWNQTDQSNIRLCIGIHTGYAVVGNIGSEQRLEYTAIGDTVNIASRLTGLCKDQGAKIILSEQTVGKSNMDPKYYKCLGEVKLSGRATETVVFSIDPFQKEVQT